MREKLISLTTANIWSKNKINMKEILNDYETYGPFVLVDREHYEEFCSY